MKEKKLYIGDIEERLGVHRTTFFYWEKTGKVPKARREPMSNFRYWTEAEVRKIEKIVKGV